MEQVKFKERFEPRTIYLKRNENGYCSKLINYCGKTTRSWVCGPPWFCAFWSFSYYTEITAAEFTEWEWYIKNVYHVSRSVEHCKDPAIIRQIAKLVNYQEQQKGATV